MNHHRLNPKNKPTCINKNINHPHIVFLPRFTNARWPWEFSAAEMKSESQNQDKTSKHHDKTPYLSIGDAGGEPFRIQATPSSKNPQNVALL